MPSEPQPHPRRDTPVLSEYASDPDFGDILAMFVEEMPVRIRGLEEAWGRNDLETVRRIAHQLKGAGGGYGFPSVTVAARRVEEGLRSLMNQQPDARLDDLRRDIDDLVNLCGRLQA